jgi:hypothetical protein
LEVEFLPIEIKLIPIIFTLFSMLLSLFFFKNYIYIIYHIYNIYFIINFFFKKKIYINKLNYNILIDFISFFKFFFNAYYFNEVYNSFIYKFRNLGYILFKNLDKGFIETIGPMFIVNFIQNIKFFFAKKHKGLIDHYVFIMIFGLFGIIIFIYFLDI